LCDNNYGTITALILLVGCYKDHIACETCIHICTFLGRIALYAAYCYLAKTAEPIEVLVKQHTRVHLVNYCFPRQLVISSCLVDFLSSLLPHLYIRLGQTKTFQGI